ncbi:rhodanese-like domain-containing protein [Leifsonia sp. NPDC058230]|uniref:rhodanese-like domain-containing protein n=1 Tax=Leifsonia sp. NPDC058230 TaxID=3346391 RepID=UPI0036DC0E65
MPGAYLDDDEVSAARAVELVDTGSAWLLDVREAHEWDAGHAPGAHHIPLYEIEARQHELPEAEQILVICHSGSRSRLVTDALIRADYPTANVAGGMTAWQASGAQVVRDDGSPGAVV